MMLNRTTIPGAVFMLVAVLLGSCPYWAAQERQGPLPPPPPKREVVRIPAEPTAELPPIPVEDIVRRFTQKEDEFLRARSAYAYKKTIRVQEYDEEGQAAGEFRLGTELVVAADGKQYEKVVEHPPATLKRMTLALEDVETLGRIPPFILTTEQLAKYQLTYSGKQPVDELTTYIFRVEPRQLERTRAYFQGVVWVDDRDLVIVKTYGKWVTETGDVASPELPFTTFETYRELTDGRYWFPIYSRSDDTLKLKSGEVQARLTIRWTDYKPLSPAQSNRSLQR